MARGRRQTRSLLELMDPKQDYHPAVGTVRTEANPMPEVKKLEKKEPPKPAKVQSTEPQEELTTEPLPAAEQDKIRITINYPLAALICFAVLVIVICTFLVGWKLGRDKASRQQQKIEHEHRLPGV